MIGKDRPTKELMDDLDRILAAQKAKIEGILEAAEKLSSAASIFLCDSFNIETNCGEGTDDECEYTGMCATQTFLEYAHEDEDVTRMIETLKEAQEAYKAAKAVRIE